MMLTRFARLATGRPRWVLAGALILLLAAGAIGGGVAERLTTGGFEDPDAESSLADEVLDTQFGAGSANVVLLVTAEGGDVDDPAVAAAGQALTDELAAEPDLTGVVSYWSEGNAPPLASEAGDRALIVGRIDLPEDDLGDRIWPPATRGRTARSTWPSAARPRSSTRCPRRSRATCSGPS
jgi:RND superfamily putative drug exporter